MTKYHMWHQLPNFFNLQTTTKNIQVQFIIHQYKKGQKIVNVLSYMYIVQVGVSSESGQPFGFDCTIVLIELR